MSNIPSLKVLHDNRDDLLLAEVAAWLHDDFKHTDQQIYKYVNNAPSPSGRQDTGDLIPRRSITLLGKTLTFDVVKNRRKDDFYNGFLNRCHYAAHIEKEDAPAQQTYPAYVSSPFGYEHATIPTNLTQDLHQQISWQTIAHDPFTEQERSALQTEIKALFSRVGGDTRRSTNEVILWDWSSTVAVLYKAALAGALLGYQPKASDLRWRLLGIRVNGLDYLAGAARIPDLLARQELLNDGLDRVRDLLEVTYPLGSEVYRDENGSVFVVPNIADLLEITDERGTSLRALILETFSKGTVKDQPALRVSGEILPQIELEQQPWWGQDPEWEAKTQLDKDTNSPKNPALYGQELKNEIPGIGAFLLRKIVSSSDSDWVKKFWADNPSDICTVCGLRPRGPGKKARDRSVCDVCEERRADRSKTWVKSQPDRTIWTAEVADTNGRLALMVGQFDLRHWLDGSLVESLLVIAPDNAQQPVKKTPSFSRLRRIWETTRSFWKDVENDTLTQLSDDRRRLKIYLTQQPDLGPYHVYDLQLGQVELDVVWVPPHDNTEGYLLTADNLNYIARRLGAEKQIYENSATAAIWVEDYLRAQFLPSNSNSKNQPVLYNSDASPSKRKSNLINGVFVHDIQYQSNQYATAIPILAEPQIFMALVPAGRALPIVQAIQAKYQREMGKVQNRLPLHLGVVFASRRTPLQAILEAGRAMLKRAVNSEQWTVSSTCACGKSDAPAPLKDSAHFEQWQEVRLKNANGREITLPVPTVMGDGKTKDLWYPYFELAGAPAAHHVCRFEQNGKTWVHVNNLKKEDDTVHFTPSTFDFEFLDAASRRFEVYYDKEGRRPRRTRPFYLQDVERLENLWKEHFSRLKRSQFSQTLQTIEAARERWFGRDKEQKSVTDVTFCRFVEDTLANASWPKGRAWQTLIEDQKKQLTEAAVRGELADWAEIHLEILKEKMEGEQP